MESRGLKMTLPLVARQARDLGVQYGEARIVDNRYRWGSCTVKDNVNFNWRLLKPSGRAGPWRFAIVPRCR